MEVHWPMYLDVLATTPVRGSSNTHLLIPGPTVGKGAGVTSPPQREVAAGPSYPPSSATGRLPIEEVGHEYNIPTGLIGRACNSECIGCF